MSRLTRWNSEGHLMLGNELEIGYKLAEYEDLEEKGLLLKLPCKMGDYMYDISLESNTITPVRINEIIIYTLNNDTYSYQYNCCSFDAHGDVYAEYEVDANDIGKTVFLTKEEAEQELKRLEGAE